MVEGVPSEILPGDAQFVHECVKRCSRNPRRLAASVTTPPASRKIRIMCSRSTCSSVVDPEATISLLWISTNGALKNGLLRTLSSPSHLCAYHPAERRRWRNPHDLGRVRGRCANLFGSIPSKSPTSTMPCRSRSVAPARNQFIAIMLYGSHQLRPRIGGCGPTSPVPIYGRRPCPNTIVPGRAPVCLPPRSSTTTPLTITYSTPVEYWCGCS